jgi:pterin-4a-carbinolamine dehydratase
VSIEAGRVRLSIPNRHNAGITEAERRLAAKVDAVIDAR